MAWGGSNGEDGWRSAFEKVGYSIKLPPISGAGSVDERIHRTYSLIKRNKLIVFSTLEKLIGDIKNYSYELDDDGEATNKIADQNTWHRIDALGYLATAVYEGLADFKPGQSIKRFEGPKEIEPLAKIGSRSKRMKSALQYRHGIPRDRSSDVGATLRTAGGDQ
jgi:hypothetical protein